VLQTDDLFLGAFGLVRGGELQEVVVRGVNGRRMAVFHIAGPGMEDVERDYYRGATTVNLQLLKSQMRRLKDLAFEAIREEERKNASHERGDRTNQSGQRSRRSSRRARHHS
jgi:hypothetical protein